MAGVRGITVKTIEAMVPGDRLLCEKVPGLRLDCLDSGTKTWSFRFVTKGGRARKPGLGHYPLVSIADARRIACEMKLEVSAGRDPIVTRAQVNQDITLDELWNRCEKEHWNRGKSWDREAYLLYHGCWSPKLGNRPVKEVEFEHIAGVYQKMSGTPVRANRALAVLNKMFGLAEKWRLRPQGTNPCRLVDRRFQEKSRKRYASEAELARIGAILERLFADSNTRQEAAFFYLLIFTGARPSEILRATPDMVRSVPNSESGILEISEGKTGERTVFLPPQAMKVLAQLDPRRASLAGVTSAPEVLWDQIRTEAGCPDLWMRDFRRTFGSTGLSQGLSLDALGRLLGHQSADTTLIYAKLKEAKALEAVGDTADTLARALDSKDTGNLQEYILDPFS